MNMKPPEILSMIEEATGTSMYESKKDSAQRMIEKKENKLSQINRVSRIRTIVHSTQLSLLCF